MQQVFMNKQVEELLNTLSGQHHVDSFTCDVIEESAAVVVASRVRSGVGRHAHAGGCGRRSC